ncbi:hypothetical protein OHS70_36380 [Streptomyces sp. NBC_00390]
MTILAERRHGLRDQQQIKDAPEFHRDKHLGDRAHHDEPGTYYGTGGPFA